MPIESLFEGMRWGSWLIVPLTSVFTCTPEVVGKQDQPQSALCPVSSQVRAAEAIEQLRGQECQTDGEQKMKEYRLKMAEEHLKEGRYQQAIHAASCAW